jgi:hypothetical protein
MMADAKRKLPGPSPAELAEMSDDELEVKGIAFLGERNTRASRACLLELQRRTGPFGLYPLPQRWQSKMADDEFKAHAETIRRGVGAKVAVIKRGLAVWIERNTTPGDGAAVEIALLEMALDRYVGKHGETDAFDFVQRSFRKVVEQRQRGPIGHA